MLEQSVSFAQRAALPEIVSGRPTTKIARTELTDQLTPRVRLDRAKMRCGRNHFVPGGNQAVTTMSVFPSALSSGRPCDADALFRHSEDLSHKNSHPFDAGDWTSKPAFGDHAHPAC
jgi:hypothetical protein